MYIAGNHIAMNKSETNWLFATEPYRYAVDIANIIAPTSDNDYGFPDEYSSQGLDAFYCLQKDGFDFLFTKEEFFEKREIQEELNKRQIDPEAFWHALQLLDYMADDKFKQPHVLSPTHKDQVQQFIGALDTQGAKLIAKKGNGRNIVIESKTIISTIAQILQGCVDNDAFDDQSRLFGLNSHREGSITERIAYEAIILKDFFRIQYSMQHDGSDEGYKNPLLLISRLLYFMRLATSEEYWVSSDRLKGDLRSYPEPGKDFIANRFLF